jgi:hypothetical protein
MLRCIETSGERRTFACTKAGGMPQAFRLQKSREIEVFRLSG